MNKELFSGNEAVARGAYEAGVRVAAAYPGTPSTEILENLQRYWKIWRATKRSIPNGRPTKRLPWMSPSAPPMQAAGQWLL
jgi:TPP-dependent indolepyruvate ferredoxin oxidoreductase alpha subunit